MHVDGFRFDLASTLARELFEVNKLGRVLRHHPPGPGPSQVKLIAEPWDVGPGGYQVGNFPVRWTEWNGKYRDNVRRFWKGDGGTASEFATRLAGSSDLYERSGRQPYASINFVTCHDGFTLHDLVSYNEKHNEANGEDNRDGADDNDSLELRRRGADRRPGDQRPARPAEAELLATLLLSQGVPMLLAGDELGHTQKGNNNTYCQDNELTWLDWELDDGAAEVPGRSCRRVTQLWREQPVLQRRTFFQGRSIRGAGIKDISWFEPDRQGDDRRGLGRGLRQVPGGAAGRRPDRRDGRARRADRRRHAAGPAQRPPRGDPVHPAADEPGATTGSCCSTRPTTTCPPDRSPAGRRTRCGTGRWRVFRTACRRRPTSRTSPPLQAEALRKEAGGARTAAGTPARSMTDARSSDDQ